MSCPSSAKRLNRREIMKSMALAPLGFHSAPLFSGMPFGGFPNLLDNHSPSFLFSDLHLAPNYPAKPPLTDITALVAPGSDRYITEKYAVEIESLLKKWSQALCSSPAGLATVAALIDDSIEASTLEAERVTVLRSAHGIETVSRRFKPEVARGRERMIDGLSAWLGGAQKIETVEFEIFGIEQIAAAPLAVRADIRYDFVMFGIGSSKEERVGTWHTEWFQNPTGAWKARKWEAWEESIAVAKSPVFIDVTAQALGGNNSYHRQLLHGADYWRTVLDGAIGTDVYCNNGVAVGDYDNDGYDDFYVCQSAGLPNRLFRNRGDGTFEDVTAKSGVGILDNTACAIFADFDNKGVQDLLVVCGTGPLLYLNQGDGTFRLKRNAFQFARQPQGTFTHAAVADYDGDGRLDVYFCMYMYYLGLDQYHYPVPYFDARNGPPNCLFHNEGNGSFVETTEAAGMNRDNDRYTFACAWGDSNGNGLPDLFVSNDFGTSQLYRNNGDGTFAVASAEAHVEGVGAGMGCSWCDYDNDGRQDIYVPSMWEASGQRVSGQGQFHASAPESVRELYRRHARGNALYRNQGNGTFENVGHQAGVEMGRWSWSADFFDFDHDGYSDLYVSNGYISALDRYDLASFFWRQIVANSPEDASPVPAYEQGWNAINELMRSDHTWHGYARNVLFANNHNGSFSEISGPSGLDFIEDARTFVLADIDHDGRLELIIKNRNAPQVRVLHNVLLDIGKSISFRLRGTKSNRDAVGSCVTVEVPGLKQQKFVQAGTGFLAQHSKELFFGLGTHAGEIRTTVRWPSGLVQHFSNLSANHRIVIEEGSEHFLSERYVAAPASYANASPVSAGEVLPAAVSTWLIEPLKAPALKLTEAQGNTHDLKGYRGKFVLLSFCYGADAECNNQLKAIQANLQRLKVALLEPLAVFVDDVGAGSMAATVQFPVLIASSEIIGIYNIIYRHLFDRRRDMPLPVSFLIDREGMIVRVYQGPFEVAQVLSDTKSISTDASERMRMALPFEGRLEQDSFHRNDFTYGVAMYQHGYLEQAALSFEQVIAAKPDNADAYYNLGTLRLQRKDFEEASQYLEQALKYKPNYPEAWNNLGMIAAQTNRPADAISNFEQSLSLRPAYVTALLNLGNVYRRQKDIENAQKCFDRAIEIQPDNAEISYSMGMLYAQQDRFEHASHFLEKAIELRPDYGEAFNNLGVLYVRSQNFTRAEQKFTNAIRVAPQFDQPYLNLARLYILQNDRAKARDVLKQLLSMQPDNAAAKRALEGVQ
jgi:Flp pilus assembly protein TadD/peroxiredoxin